MATYNSDGTTADINNLIAAASSGDIITIPAGPFTWGASSAFVNCTKAITLQGAGTGQTVITVSSGAHSSGVIQVYAGATFKDFAIVPSSGKTNFGISANGWRITNILYNQAAASVVAYFALINFGFGVIDNCYITGGGGNNELIFGQGPDTAWDTAYIPGTANALFIESNVFDGLGYVCDANSNAIFVVRYNTIRGQMKIDGHGINTNSSPVRGVRAMEIYGNVWTATNGSNWAAVEVRGGVGFIWGNYISGSSAVLGYYRLTDYAVSAPGSNFGGVYQTPYNWPIPDQVGAGPGATGTQVGGGQPLYFFNNIKGTSLGTLRFDAFDNLNRYTVPASYTIGTTAIGMSGGSIVANNYIQFSGDSRSYQVLTGYGSSTGTIHISPPLEVELPAIRISGFYGPNANYRGQTNSGSIIFTQGPNQPCIIQNRRDYFQTVTGFDNSSTGVGSGTYAQMTALAPSQSGVTFWTNDRGSWNANLPADSAGQLYQWNGSTWGVFYTPYTYPFYSSSGDVTVYAYKRLGRNPRFRGLVAVS